MKTIPICMLLSVLFLGCCSQEPVIKGMYCIDPPNFPNYKGQVTLSFYHITNIDSLDLIIANVDSLLEKIVYPEIAEHSRVQGGVTISFKLDSTRVAKDIKFFNRLRAGIVESILTGLKSFKFKFENETGIKDLDGILTFSFKLYPQKEKAKFN